MAYGTIKVDNITFTNGGVDQTITVSGVVQSISGDITATGTIQAATIIGTSTVSGATVTGDAGSFTTVTGGVATITSGVFALGTDALPSISFSSDPNTGIYSPGADQVAISTNGTPRVQFGTGEVVFNDGGANYDFRIEGDTVSNLFFVDASADKVGVGTISPSNKFVVSTSNQGLEVSPGSTNTLLSYDRGATAYLPIRIRASSHAFSNASTDFATIDSSGRLLVGTTTAISILEGSIDKVGTGVSTSQAGINIGQFCNSASATARPILNFYRTRGTQATPTANSSGDLLAQINFNAYDGNSTDSYGAASIECFADAAHGVTDTPGRLVFSTNPGSPATGPTERMRITSAGDIGTSAGLTLGSITPSAGGFYSTAAILGTGAGTNAVKFNTATGKITYDTSSRLNKEQIENCPYGIAEIKQLQPRRYYRIDDQRLEVGFVADEVVGILPEFVPFGPKSAITGNEQDTEEIPLGVNYEKLTAVLTAALQEAVAKIESLEARLDAANL